MGIKTVPYPPSSPDLALCDFWLFRGCRYETIEEMKEAVTKVIDALTQEDFHGAFQKLLERYNKCIATGGDYSEWDLSVMSVLSMKVPIRKKSGKLFNDPRISIQFINNVFISSFSIILMLASELPSPFSKFNSHHFLVISTIVHTQTFLLFFSDFNSNCLFIKNPFYEGCSSEYYSSWLHAAYSNV